MTLTGAGFIAGTTNVGVVSGISSIISASPAIVAAVQNSTTIQLTITVPAAGDLLLPFSSGGAVVLGVRNGASCTGVVPGGTVQFTIGGVPIISAVTSGSSFAVATPPTLTRIAPYDIISIFGSNFCLSGRTGGCTSTMYGAIDPGSLVYATSLTPSGDTRKLSVTFQSHGNPVTKIGDAPLLFATNNQINLIVPDAVKNYDGVNLSSTVDLVVNFGSTKSSVYSLTVAAQNPGVFTVGGDGTGDAAALGPNDLGPYGPVVNAHRAFVDNNTGTPNVLQLYVTGLGVPDTGATWSTDTFICMSVADYVSAVNAAPATTTQITAADGAILQSSLFPSGQHQPCMKSTAGTVKVLLGTKDVTANVLYAGWVADSVAGLYQINVKLPDATSDTTLAGYYDNAGTPVLLTVANLDAVHKLPVQVSFGTAPNVVTSQLGATVAVKGHLTVTATGTIAAGPTVSGALTYAITHGGTGTIAGYTATGLPAEVIIDANSGQFTGPATGTAADNGTFQVKVTVTDTNNWTGVVDVQIVVTNL